MNCKKCEDLNERLNRALTKLDQVRSANTIEEVRAIVGRVVGLEVKGAKHGHSSKEVEDGKVCT